MSMPNWEGFMAPLLAVMADGNVRNRREINEAVAVQAALSEDDLAETLGSGQPKFANRIGWGLSFLTNVGALERPARGHYRITEAGRAVLKRFPDGVRERDFAIFAEDPTSGISAYSAVVKASSTESSEAGGSEELDPTEQVNEGIDRIHRQVGADLLQRLHAQDPAFFEAAVVQLLVKMGYGGADGRATVTAKSNDGGIDGIIDQDTLGLSRVYVQAKRYALDATIDRPAIQSFVGALDGRAGSGVFITTASFTKGARDYAESRSTRVILIDGPRLARLMIQYGVGVQEKQTVRIVEVDEDFFE
ncbi:MAG: restriction endonuclease [Nocardioidaceae bacterium]